MAHGLPRGRETMQNLRTSLLWNGAINTIPSQFRVSLLVFFYAALTVAVHFVPLFQESRRREARAPAFWSLRVPMSAGPPRCVCGICGIVWGMCVALSLASLYCCIHPQNPHSCARLLFDFGYFRGGYAGPWGPRNPICAPYRNCLEKGSRWIPQEGVAHKTYWSPGSLKNPDLCHALKK